MQLFWKLQAGMPNSKCIKIHPAKDDNGKMLVTVGFSINSKAA